jgi:hypothetical protein
MHFFLRLCPSKKRNLCSQKSCKGSFLEVTATSAVTRPAYIRCYICKFVADSAQSESTLLRQDPIRQVFEFFRVFGVNLLVVFFRAI